MKILDIAERTSFTSYSIFVSGIQVSTCVNLLTNLYFVNLNLQSFLFVLTSCLLLSTGGLLSLLLGGEIEHVARIGELAAGTTLESRKRNLMIESLEETVQLPLFGHLKRAKKLEYLIIADVCLTVTGLCLAILNRLGILLL